MYISGRMVAAVRREIDDIMAELDGWDDPRAQKVCKKLRGARKALPETDARLDEGRWGGVHALRGGDESGGDIWITHQRAKRVKVRLAAAHAMIATFVPPQRESVRTEGGVNRPVPEHPLRRELWDLRYMSQIWDAWFMDAITDLSVRTWGYGGGQKVREGVERRVLEELDEVFDEEDRAAGETDRLGEDNFAGKGKDRSGGLGAEHDEERG